MDKAAKEKFKTIIDLATEVSEQGIAQVFASYHGHVQLIEVDAYPVDTDYGPDSTYKRLFGHRIFTKLCTSKALLTELDAVIADLEALKTEAKVPA